MQRNIFDLTPSNELLNFDTNVITNQYHESYFTETREQYILEILSKSENISRCEPKPIRPENLRELLVCGLCQDIIITPFQPNCSHVFCRKCITENLRINKCCPTCKKVALKPAVYNRQVECFLTVMVSNFNSKSNNYLIYEQRRKMHELFFSNELNLFTKHIYDLKTNRIQILRNDRLWTSKEKKLFRIGLERYEGEELKVYWELAGISVDFVKSATIDQLIAVALNTDTKIPTTKVGEINLGLLRNILVYMLE